MGVWIEESGVRGKAINYTRIKKCACQGKLTLSMWYIDQMKTLSKAGRTKAIYSYGRPGMNNVISL